MSTNAPGRHPRVAKLAWLLILLLAMGAATLVHAPRQAKAAPAAGIAHLPTQELSLGPCSGTSTTVSCQFATDVTVPVGGTWTEQVSLPAGSTVASTTQGSCGGAVTTLPGGILQIGPCTAALPAGTPITATLNLSAPASNIQLSVVYNANGPINSPITNTACQGTSTNECIFTFPYVAATPTQSATVNITLPCLPEAGAGPYSCNDTLSGTNYPTIGGNLPFAPSSPCTIVYTPAASPTVNTLTATAVVTCAAGTNQAIAAGSTLDITVSAPGATGNVPPTATFAVSNPVTVPAPSLARQTFGPPPLPAPLPRPRR